MGPNRPTGTDDRFDPVNASSRWLNNNYYSSYLYIMDLIYVMVSLYWLFSFVCYSSCRCVFIRVVSACSLFPLLFIIDTTIFIILVIIICDYTVIIFILHQHFLHLQLTSSQNGWMVSLCDLLPFLNCQYHNNSNYNNHIYNCCR